LLGETNDLKAHVLPSIEQLPNDPKDILARHLLLMEDVQAGREVIHRLDRPLERRRSNRLSSEEHTGCEHHSGANTVSAIR
jgi:hypothetical protein